MKKEKCCIKTETIYTKKSIFFIKKPIVLVNLPLRMGASAPVLGYVYSCTWVPLLEALDKLTRSTRADLPVFTKRQSKPLIIKCHISHLERLLCTRKAVNKSDIQVRENVKSR